MNEIPSGQITSYQSGQIDMLTTAGGEPGNGGKPISAYRPGVAAILGPTGRRAWGITGMRGGSGGMGGRIVTRRRQVSRSWGVIRCQREALRKKAPRSSGVMEANF